MKKLRELQNDAQQIFNNDTVIRDIVKENMQDYY